MALLSTPPDYAHPTPATDEGPAAQVHHAHVRPWHQLTVAAIARAWAHDPDVICDLVATLLDIHLRHSDRSSDLTLDELHLMIALELQQLGGEGEED
jgi:hypothetical protein